MEILSVLLADSLNLILRHVSGLDRYVQGARQLFMGQEMAVMWRELSMIHANCITAKRKWRIEGCEHQDIQ